MRGAIELGCVLGGARGSGVRAIDDAAGRRAQAGLGEADIRELLEAAKASAKAARESVDYARVTPDILTQILAKLDKIENKLDKIENAVKATALRRATR